MIADATLVIRRFQQVDYHLQLSNDEVQNLVNILEIDILTWPTASERSRTTLAKLKPLFA